VFNTGMVLDGFVSVLKERSDPIIMRGAERAAEFLVTDMTEQGLFVTNGNFTSPGTIKIYNVLCAWALYRLGTLIGNRRYCDSAIKAVEAALRFQNERGWFAENCLSDSLRPLTHTIGYAAQGILEVGIATAREDFVESSQRCLRALTPNILPNGFLAGRFDSTWRATVRWSCLTGSAQIAVIAYRLYQIRGEDIYRETADRLVNFLKAVQRIDTGRDGIDGALSGSFPIMGDYMSAGYPNWATKYLLDALMLQIECSRTPLTTTNGNSSIQI